MNRGELLRHVGQYTDVTLQRLDKLQHLMQSHGASVADAHQKALMLLDGMIHKQAAMLAFERLFLAFGVMMLVALPLLLLMKNTRFTRQGLSADH